MANIEQGGETGEKQLSPAERIRRAKDAIETGRNLGMALDLAAKLEGLTRYAEKKPEECGGILQVFEGMEKELRKAPERQRFDWGGFEKEINRWWDDLKKELGDRFEEMIK